MGVMGRSLLTAGEVASLLGVPTSWVYEQSRRVGNPTVTLGRYRRYRAEAIADWIVALEAGAAPTSAGSAPIQQLKLHAAGSRAGR
jgi:hypothetical protein